MTEARALVLIGIGAIVFTSVAVTSMAACGITGPLLSLGAIVPLALGADGVGRVVMHYGASGKRRRPEQGQAEMEKKTQAPVS